MVCAKMLHLKNTNYHLLEAASDLRNFESYCDVTIEVGDEHIFLSHKMVLAAVSSVLKAAFEDIPACQQISLIIPDAEQESIELLLTLLYYGKQECDEEQYCKLIDVLHLLCVDGLGTIRVGSKVESVPGKCKLGGAEGIVSTGTESIDCSKLIDNWNDKISKLDLKVEVDEVPSSDVNNDDDIIAWNSIEASSPVADDDDLGFISSLPTDTSIYMSEEPHSSQEYDSIPSHFLDSMQTDDVDTSYPEAKPPKIKKLSLKKKKRHLCKMCNHSCMRLNDLESHYGNVHKLEKQFTCDICKKMYVLEENMMKHRHHVHNVMQQAGLKKDNNGNGETANSKLESNNCNGDLKNDLSINNNSPTVDQGQKSEVVFRCNLCPMYFSQGCLLRRHAKVHTENKAFVCPICDCRFKYKDNCTRHQRSVHIKDYTHKCQCGKGFLFPYTLAKHQQTCALTS